MDFFLSRYRNLTVLLIVIVAQLLLIAYQVKSNKDVALIRVWAVTAVTPVEQSLEFVRRYTWGFVEDYFVLLGVRSQNDKLQHENGELKLENHYLKAELSTADRAKALSVFQAHSRSKTVAARVTDPEKRLALYKTIQRQIMDDAPWVFVNSVLQVRAALKEVKGFGLNPTQMFFDMDQVSVEK
jgi:cell shape-determining protein MreC